jgi:2-amino-4-hydroxy-6-hydroxymethyldihydropteridine diphosphokinase
VTLAYVGIGSNLREPASQVRGAFDELARLPDTRMTARSSLYRSAPMGYAAQPDFVNAVAALETGLSARDLLTELQKIEDRHGRARSFANAPRTLDLDLLLFGDERIAAQDLVVPHPRMHERAFVLRPLLEIAPGLEAYRPFLEACDTQEIERID